MTLSVKNIKVRSLYVYMTDKDKPSFNTPESVFSLIYKPMYSVVCKTR